MADIYNQTAYAQVYRHLRWPGYSDESVRGMVRRMIKAGELVQAKDGFVLGDQGKRLVEELAPVRQYQRRRWDGLWRVIVYDVPEKDKYKRNRLSHELNRYGYAMWQKSVYLSPHPVMEPVIKWLKKQGLYGKAICLESHQAGGLNNRALSTQVFKGRERMGKWEGLVGRGYQVLRENRGNTTWVRDYETELHRDPWLPPELETTGVEVARHKAAIIMQKLVS